jgi:hypothetical protein
MVSPLGSPNLAACPNLCADAAGLARAFLACSRGLPTCAQQMFGANLTPTNTIAGVCLTRRRVFVH